MTKENIPGQIPRVEGKSFSSLGSVKAVCSEEGHKGFPVPPSIPTALSSSMSSSSLPTSYLESLQDQGECEQAC